MIEVLNNIRYAEKIVSKIKKYSSKQKGSMAQQKKKYTVLNKQVWRYCE